MRRLADALALDEGSFDIRSNKGGPAVSGEGTLRGEDVWVQLSLGLSGPAREVCFRKVQGRDDHLGDRNCLASIRELVDPGRFAARIRRELRLYTSQPVVPRPVACTKANMRILFVRVRLVVQESGYSYLLYIPFPEISLQR